jgi:5-methylcytosine-specific restriction endonuclease McrA
MKMKDHEWGRYPRAKKKGSDKSMDEVIKELKKPPFPQSDYRERSLKIHDLICAKCGREFDHTNRHLLTVHHKDGNPRNNPPDGSNWENLCVYCHDDEHSRELLGKYLSDEKKDE